jgi:hypothetical protein
VIKERADVASQLNLLSLVLFYTKPEKMKTMVIILILVTTLFVFHASSLELFVF